jgi:hypothetical protein
MASFMAASLRRARVAAPHPGGMRPLHPRRPDTGRMPLFFAPRRPLLRGAMLGGTAYLAGRAGARSQERAYAGG